MDNHSIQFLVLAALALVAQLLLAWLLFRLGRRAGVQPWQSMLVLLASGMLLAHLGRRILPEQLPICTDSVVNYFHCLGL
jgi:uncharacterized membrane protein